MKTCNMKTISDVAESIDLFINFLNKVGFNAEANTLINTQKGVMPEECFFENLTSLYRLMPADKFTISKYIFMIQEIVKTIQKANITYTKVAGVGYSLAYNFQKSCKKLKQ